jgi:hypothetical protein
MKGGIPVVQGAKMLRHQADYIAQLEKGLESSIAMNKAQAERQVKELTDEDRSMLIRTLKWAEDLLREAGHDEAVNDVSGLLIISEPKPVRSKRPKTRKVKNPRAVKAKKIVKSKKPKIKKRVVPKVKPYKEN